MDVFTWQLQRRRFGLWVPAAPAETVTADSAQDALQHARTTRPPAAGQWRICVWHGTTIGRIPAATHEPAPTAADKNKTDQKGAGR